MCACDRDYSCPACHRFDDPGGWLDAAAKQEREERESSLYGHTRPADATEPLGLRIRL